MRDGPLAGLVVAEVLRLQGLQRRFDEGHDLAGISDAEADLALLAHQRRSLVPGGQRQVLVGQIALGLQVELDIGGVVLDRRRQAHRPQRTYPLDLAGALGFRILVQQGLHVEEDSCQRLVGQALETVVEASGVHAFARVRALQRCLEKPLGPTEHQRVVLDREDRTVVVVDRRTRHVALFLRLRLVDQAVERLGVLNLEHGNEVVIGVGEE